MATPIHSELSVGPVRLGDVLSQGRSHVIGTEKENY